MRSAVLGASRLRLWGEWVSLFIGAPIVMKVTFGLYPLFPVVFAFAGLAAILLEMTPGWRWRALWRGPVFGEWRLIAAYFALTLTVCLAVVLVQVPDLFLSTPLQRPELWIMIMVLYPLASAAPQELIYRSLFFERYGALFANAPMAIAANGFAFGFGHLFYDNWITIGMTGIGGAIMGWAYLRHRSFGLVWVLHSLAGQIIFTVGLGVYFYHGAVGAAP